MQNKYIIITSIIIFILCILFITYFPKNNTAKDDNIKIASFTPSATEYIYAVGLDDKLAANTTFCNYPKDASKKEKIGAYNSINYELISRLGINTAIIQQGANSPKEKLMQMGIKVIEINNSDINNIISSFDILGDSFNIRKKTDIVKNNIEKQIDNIKKSAQQGKKEKAVVIVFRDYSANRLSSMTIAGGNNIYNDILHILNLENPFETSPAYTDISLEGLINANPDIIFELNYGDNIETSKDVWKKFNRINASKNNKIFIMPEPIVTLPGPRIAQIIELFYNIKTGKNNAESK